MSHADLWSVTTLVAVLKTDKEFTKEVCAKSLIKDDGNNDSEKEGLNLREILR